MRDSVDDVVAMRAVGVDTSRLNRMVAWSLGVHVMVVAVLFLAPRDWFDRTEPAPVLMTISLGGTPGPVTTGMAPLAGKTVERVTPTPPKPEPPRPPEAKVDDLQALANRVLTSTKVSDSAKATPTRTPVTATEASKGNARVPTPSRTEGAGLASGGGVGADRVMGLDANFCCMSYVTQVLGLIDGAWQKGFTDRGTSVVTFVIHRDGRIDGIELRNSSGSSVLDRAARAAVMDVAAKRVAPLPAEYGEERLVIHLRFPYGGS